MRLGDHHRLGVRRADALRVEAGLDAGPHLPGHAPLLHGRGLEGDPDRDLVGGDGLDAPDLRLLDDHALEVLVVPQVVGDLAQHRPHPRDVLPVGDRHVEHRAGPVLALVAHPEDLAVADVPDRPVDVAQPGDAEADGLDGAAGRAQVDDVAHAQLVLEDHEGAGQEVLDEVLGAEAQGDADDPCAGDDRPDVVVQLGQHHRDDDRHDDAGDHALEQVAHAARSLHPAAARAVAVLGRAPAHGHLAEPVGQHAFLGPADQPVDDPVQQPARDQPDDEDAEQRRAACRSRTSDSSASCSLPLSSS